MKKLYFLSLVLGTAFTFGQQTLPFSDSFSYIAGNLHTTAPWGVLGTASATDQIVLDGSKVTFDAGGTDAQLMITPQTSETVFYKFDLRVLNMAGVTDANGGYLSGFTQNSTTFGGTLWTKRVDDTSYNLGIETRTATGVSTTYSTGAYNTGVTNTIVVSYTFNTGTTSDDTVKLWINPTAGDEGSPLLTDIHTGTDLTSIVSFFLRQDSATETPSVEIDNLKVSLTFADVLSTKSFNTIEGLKMYPNPLTGNTLNFSTTANADMSVQIFDILGKEVLNTKVVNNTVNTSKLNAGVYIVKITEEGKTATRKLVVR